MKRVLKAELLCARLRLLAQSTLACPSVQPAWLLLTTCAACALDFDVRIHPPAVIQPLADRLVQ